MILSCFRCADSSAAGAKYQDRVYGKGKRVHNPTDKRIASKRKYRCTVCMNERTAGK